MTMTCCPYGSATVYRSPGGDNDALRLADRKAAEEGGGAHVHMDAASAIFVVVRALPRQAVYLAALRC